MEVKSKNLSSVVESCEERLKEGLERALAGAMEWTLHPTEEDAVSELARGELVFLMAVSALAHLDAEVSGIILKEVERWSLFPRLRKYMSGKLDAEWKVPRKMIERAAKFAQILERSGLFLVPPELQAYLAELLAEDEARHVGAENNSQEGAAGGSEDASESKRPRKDPRSSPSQQVEESSVRGQTSVGEPQQEKRYRLEEEVRRRRSRKKGGQGQEKKGKQQVLTPPPQNFSRSTTEPSPEPSKIETSTCPQQNAMPTGAIPKVLRQAKSVEPQTVHSPATGTIPRVHKEERRSSPVDRATAAPRAHQVTSTGCQTEEPPTSPAVQVTSAASQTLPLPRVSKEEAQRQLWEGVREDDGQLIEGAVASGADMEAVGEGGMTALNEAAWHGRLEAVRALLRLGARLEGRGMGGTALHWASGGGHEAVARLLVEAGASLEAEDKDGWTPLHWASYWGHLPIVRLLVEAGADLSHRDRQGRTPLALAEIRGRSAVAAYLRSVGATT